jgi:Zn-dependent membrane protease YugP
MDALLSWLFYDQFRSGYFALVLGLGALQLCVGGMYSLVRSRLDAAHPDDLPLTAGQFAQHTAARLGLPVRVFAMGGDKAQNAYHPWWRLVTLTPETFVKRDPTCWASAAHELGHARLHQRSWLLAEVLLLARQSVGTCGWFASTVVLAQLLYGAPALSQLALYAIGATIGLYALVLLDEVLASSIAMRILRQDGRLTPARLRSARQVLQAAFATYAVGLGSKVALLFLQQEIEQRAALPLVPAEPLTGGYRVVVHVLALLVVGIVAWSLWRLLRTEPPPADAGEAARRRFVVTMLPYASGLPTLLLLALVWDQPYGAWWPVACVLAWRSTLMVLVVPALPVLMLLGVALVLVLVLVSPIVSLFVPKGRKVDPAEVEAAKAEQARAVEESAPGLAQAMRTPHRSLARGLTGWAMLLQLAAPLPVAVAVLWAEILY